MASVRRDNGKRGTTDPALLIQRSLATIDRMAEAMWRDDCNHHHRPIRNDWPHQPNSIREPWLRRGTAAFMTLLEPCPNDDH